MIRIVALLLLGLQANVRGPVILAIGDRMTIEAKLPSSDRFSVPRF